MRPKNWLAYATAGRMISLNASKLLKVHAYIAMMKIMMHIRTTQKGTKMRFFHKYVGCDTAMLVMVLYYPQCRGERTDEDVDECAEGMEEFLASGRKDIGSFISRSTCGWGVECLIQGERL